MITYLPHRRKAFRGFNPETDVSSASMLAWLEAGADCENSSGVPATNGQTIEFWRDKSTQGNDFSQSTAGDRPTFVSDGGSEYSNAPVVRFTSATNQYLTTISAGFNTLTEGEVFLLVDIEADPPAGFQASGIWKIGSGSTPHFPYIDSKIYDDFGTSNRKTVGNPTPSLETPRIYNPVSASSDWSTRLDGTQIFSTASNTVSFPADAIIGRSDVNNRLNGRIRAFFFYDAKLSTSDRTAVYNYMDSLR